MNDPRLNKLGELLTEHGIGVGRLTPRPRGGRLAGEPLKEVEQAVSAVDVSSSNSGALVYGNGCFAVGRYADAAAVYRTILERCPGDLDTRFNLGLACLRLREPREAVVEFTSALERDPTLADAYYQRGNAYDDLGESGLALNNYAQALAFYFAQAYPTPTLTAAHPWMNWVVMKRPSTTTPPLLNATRRTPMPFLTGREPITTWRILKLLSRITRMSYSSSLTTLRPITIEDWLSTPGATMKGHWKTMSRQWPCGPTSLSR
jgi:tetratricopeptide (TPR) repeat protein